MKSRTRRHLLLSPALWAATPQLAAAPQAAQAPAASADSELGKARATMQAAQAALRKVPLARATEPAFSFKA